MHTGPSESKERACPPPEGALRLARNVIGASETSIKLVELTCFAPASRIPARLSVQGSSGARN